MTFAWLLVDAVGRRKILLTGSTVLTASFILLTIFGGLAFNAPQLSIPVDAVAIPGIIALFISTAAFGIGWLVPPWLIPTEIYPQTARAQGTAVSVITWGLANFTVTLITPLLFNNIQYWVFLVLAGTNLVAGGWTWLYCPETGGRSFEENQGFFEEARKGGTWRVAKVGKGEYRRFPYDRSDEGDDESQPLLRRMRDQVDA